MKLTDDIIEAYLKGALSGPQAAEFEREMSALMRQAAPEVPSQRMLKGIRTRLAAGEGLEKAPLLGPWRSNWLRLAGLLTAPSPVLRWGAAGAAWNSSWLVLGLWPAPEAGPAKFKCAAGSGGPGSPLLPAPHSLALAWAGGPPRALPSVQSWRDGKPGLSAPGELARPRPQARLQGPH